MVIYKMNTTVKFMTLFVVGVISGLIAGGLGTSTAYALILGLIFTGISKDYKHAAALTLFTILPPLSLGAVYQYYKKKMIDIPAGLFLMVVVFFSAWTGAKFEGYIPDSYKEFALGGFLFIVSVYMFYKGYKDMGLEGMRGHHAH
jgi:uncharacterized membrane protein YfcA